MTFDDLLKRNIKNGRQYEPLFPKVSCSKTNFGSGDTFNTVNLIVNEMVAKYSYQTKKIAPLLLGKSLQETCENIYQFLYHHIQYKADGVAQYLRSPACAFKQRFEGVDCKSYSIFASCLLTNLGIKHYVRQIKQPSFNPHLFTHVYIIVPVNQQTEDIKQGYFVIDATTSNNKEPLYTMAHDTKVNLPHYGLNAPRGKKNIRTKSNATKKSTNKNIAISIVALVTGALIFNKKL